MKAFVIAIVCVACGKSGPPASSTGSAGSAPTPPTPPPAPAATSVATTSPDAAAPDASAPAGPLASCANGGDFGGAVASGDEVRYCLENTQHTCWQLAANGTISPLPPATALATKAASDLVLAAKWDPPAPPADDSKLCGATPRPPLVIVPGKPPDSDEATEGDHATSASGAHVAVVRGSKMIAHQTLEVYDRATGKRAGVAHPKTQCFHLEGYAGETAVVQEWDCANQGGDRLLIGPTAKIVARIHGNYARSDTFAHVDGDQWAFTDRSNGNVKVYDVVTGKRVGEHAFRQSLAMRAGNGRVYTFEDSGSITVSSPALKTLTHGTPPACP